MFSASDGKSGSELWQYQVRNKDDLVATFDDGVWCRKSTTGLWVRITPAQAIQVAAGDCDGEVTSVQLPTL